MPTFAQNFEIGDVVYGLSQSRAPYINSLGNELKDYCEETGAFFLCDNYNNRSFLGSPTKAFGGGPTGLTEANPTTETDIQNNLDFYEQDRGFTPLGVMEKARVKAWYDALDASRRSPKKALDAPAPKFQQHGAHGAAVTMFMIRRACKFGLEYTILTRRRNVHFVLDVPYNLGTELDMQDVVEKAKYTGANRDDANGYVPITFSELRCCYRYRADWIPTGRLKFYLNLNEVAPPWERNPALWQRYEIERAMKRYKREHPVKYRLGKLVSRLL